MKHKGEILKSRIKESGLAIKLIAERAGISSATIYRLYDVADVSFEHLQKIGKAIKHDFKNDFPEFRDKEAEENLNWKLKYLELAEKYIQVMEQNSEYQQSLGPKKK